jgi:hypothetical protein
MATVVGGQIINQPGGGLENLLSGAGNLFKAIQGQRKQSEDQRLLEQLSRTLSGQGVQPGVAGQPGAVLTPQDKLNEILSIVPQLNRPGNQNLALNLATIQQRAVPAIVKPQRSAATITFKDPQGNTVRQQKVQLTEEEFQNAQLPQGATIERGTPITQPGAGTDPASIREFQAVTGVPPAQQGTPEYEKAFFDFKEKVKKATEGRKQFVGSTPEGAFVTFNNITGKFDTTDINSELLPRNKKLLSGEVAGQLGTFDSLIAQIGDIRTLAKDNPEFIGPTEGRWNKLKSNFVDNKDFTELDRNVESLITIAYALSGKQISEKEMRMLKGAILPAVTQPGANFNAALDFAEKWLTSNRDTRIKRLKGSGFFVGGGPEEDFSTLSPEQLAAEIAKERGGG